MIPIMAMPEKAHSQPPWLRLDWRYQEGHLTASSENQRPGPLFSSNRFAFKSLEESFPESIGFQRQLGKDEELGGSPLT